MAEKQEITTVYETVEMSAEQIKQQNAAFAAMGIPAAVIDVSLFNAKMEMQQDGTWKRSTIRKPKQAETSS